MGESLLTKKLYSETTPSIKIVIISKQCNAQGTYLISCMS